MKFIILKLINFFFLSNYFKPRKPLLIKKKVQWSTYKKWTKEYIIDNYGDYSCTVISDSRPAHSNLKTTLTDYFKNHKGKSTLTLDFDPMKSKFFLKGLKFPNMYFSKKIVYIDFSFIIQLKMLEHYHMFIEMHLIF